LWQRGRGEWLCERQYPEVSCVYSVCSASRRGSDTGRIGAAGRQVMFVVPQFALVILQLACGPIDAQVDAGVEVFMIAVGNKRVMMLDIDNDFRSVSILGLIDDHVDLQNAVKIAAELFHLLVSVALDGGRQFHMLAADIDLHDEFLLTPRV